MWQPLVMSALDYACAVEYESPWRLLLPLASWVVPQGSTGEGRAAVAREVKPWRGGKLMKGAAVASSLRSKASVKNREAAERQAGKV